MAKPKSKTKAIRDAELLEIGFPEHFEHEDLMSPEYIKNRERFRRHPDMPKTIRTLRGFSNPGAMDEGVQSFLDFSMSLASFWEARKSRPKHFVAAETDDLKKHADEFRAALKRHEYLVCHYFVKQAIAEKKQAYAVEARRRFDLLLSEASFIYDYASARIHRFADTDIAPFPKEENHANARVHFCIRALTLEVDRMIVDRDNFLENAGCFDNIDNSDNIDNIHEARAKSLESLRSAVAKGQLGLNPVIAMLVNMALALPVPLTTEYVKNLLRNDKPPNYPR